MCVPTAYKIAKKQPESDWNLTKFDRKIKWKRSKNQRKKSRDNCNRESQELTKTEVNEPNWVGFFLYKNRKLQQTEQLKSNSGSNSSSSRSLVKLR